MSKTFRPYQPDQMLLMPVALQEWLPSDHLAYFISDVVDQLDLGEIESRYKQEERGYPPYHPLREAHMIVSNAAGKDYSRIPHLAKTSDAINRQLSLFYRSFHESFSHVSDIIHAMN